MSIDKNLVLLHRKSKFMSSPPLLMFIFVASLSCSSYSYVQAFLSMECLITAHVNANKYLGGVTRILIPNSLKTGVDKVIWNNLVINKTYQEMAEHYETANVAYKQKKTLIFYKLGLK